MGAVGEVDRGVDDVAEHRAGRGRTAGTAAVEHQRADRTALDEDRVVALAHAGERVGERHHRRVHAHTDRTTGVGLGDAEQLDDVAQPLGHRDVGGGDAADALVVHVAGDDAGAERDGGHDRGLGAGVVALDIGRWVALGEAQRLRLGEGHRVVGALLGHLGEDEVGGAVDDAHHPADRLAAQALAQGAHDRDATGDRRLEQQVDTRLVGDGEQFGADVGEQFLVAGDHRLAVAQGRGDQLAGGLDATDQLDDHVDAGVVDDGQRIAGEHALGQGDLALLAEVAHRDRHDLEPHTRAGLDGRGLLGDERHERGADIAATQDTDSDELHGVQATSSGPARRNGFAGGTPSDQE